MNRRTGLVRRTPLAARTGLARGGPLARTTPLKSTGPIKPKRHVQSPAETAAKDGVKARSKGSCEIAIPGVCVGRGYDFSHRIAAGRRGKWTVSNGLFSCRFCHLAITNTNGRRVEYEHLVWIVKTNADTTLTPAYVAGRGWVFLDDQGGTTPAPEPQRGKTP